MKKLLLFLALLCSCGRDSEESAGLYRRALSLYGEKRLTEAASLLRGVLKKDPGHTGACLLAARISYFQKREGDFRETMDLCLKNTKPAPALLRLEARWRMRRGDYAGARNELMKILDSGIEDPEAALLLGMIHEREDNAEEALLAYSRGLLVYHETAKIHQRLQRLYQKLGVEERAARHSALADTLKAWLKGGPR